MQICTTVYTMLYLIDSIPVPGSLRAESARIIVTSERTYPLLSQRYMMNSLHEHVQMECGICLEPVLLKEEPSARCFGLLECEHCFCLKCIRNWRGNTFADKDSATLTCPECRKKTNFVTPSPIWPATEVCPLASVDRNTVSPCLSRA